MQQNLTQNDLVKFLYHETNHQEDAAIAFQLEEQQEFNRAFSELLTVKGILDKMKCQPTNNCIENILKYSVAC